MERAALICEKMNFKGCFSLTKTATGILFKFSHPEDYQAVFKKGFHKVTGARFYRKVAVPCRPQKTFTLFVFDVPEDIPIEDVRHSLYRFNSVVEVVRLILHSQNENNPTQGKSSSCHSNKIPNKIIRKIIREHPQTFTHNHKLNTLKAHQLLNHKSLLKLPNERIEKMNRAVRKILHRVRFV